MRIKELFNIAIHSPIVWLIYFACLFLFYSNWLCVGSIGDTVFTDLVTAKEFSWRLIWGLFSISTLLVCTISVIFSLKSIHMNLQLLRLPTDYLQLIYAVLATVLVVCLVLFKEFGFGGDTVSHHLFTAGHEKNVALRIIVPLTMGFAFTAVYLIAISSTLMLVNLEKTSLDVLKLKLEKFRSSFYVTSMFLCIGIVNVYCLWGWATHATTVTEEVSKASQQIALGYTLSMSIIFSIAFMMLFVPVSLAIRKQLKDKATETLQVDDEEEYTKWKKENGLLNTPYKHFVDGLLLLSPMLVSALTSIVGEFKFL